MLPNQHISINIAIELSCFFVLFSLLVGVLLTKAYKTPLAVFFLSMLIAGCVATLVDAIAWGVESYTFFWVSNFIVHVAYGAIAFFFSYYIYSYVCLKYPSASKAAMHFSFVYSVTLSIAAFLSYFGYGLYQMNESYGYELGILFLPIYIFAILVFLANAVFILRYRKNLEKRETGILLFCTLFPILAQTSQTFYSSIMLNPIALTATAILIYVSIQSQQEMIMLEKENEMKMSIMLSQIQPHFLYNSLALISGQCDECPQAQETIVLFSEYLRGNMDSLTQNVPVPFDEELQHTQIYLQLEQMRFESKLQVEFDIAVTDFMIPVLTLQPIVENAVRHGTHRARYGGTVKLSTNEKADCYRIVVEDDGVGFDMDAALPEDGRSHVGIENVRNRLAAMCGGKLEIESVPGSGTTATIIIPKQGGANE